LLGNVHHRVRSAVEKIQPDAMMNVNEQNRSRVVMLSAAKHLTRRAGAEMLRCAQHDNPLADLDWKRS
jgi:hypothetical protein